MQYSLPFEMTSWSRCGKVPISDWDTLTLRKEPENSFNGSAVAIYKGPQKVGYVPDGSSRLITRLIDQGVALRVHVAISSEDEPEPQAPHLVIFGDIPD